MLESTWRVSLAVFLVALEMWCAAGRNQVGGDAVVSKPVKPNEVKLARGVVLSDELAAVLRSAEAGSTYTRIFVYWSDDRSATIRSVDDVLPIQDLPGVTSFSASFVYEDGSELNLNLRRYSDSVVTAQGVMAISRQSHIAIEWAAIPGRGRLTFKQSMWLATMPVSLVVTTLLMLPVGWFFPVAPDHVFAEWAVRVGAVLLSVCLLLAARTTVSVRNASRLLVAQRPPSHLIEVWTVLAGITGLGALVWGIFVYLVPRT